jgi:hypothetical protein
MPRGGQADIGHFAVLVNTSAQVLCGIHMMAVT